MNHIVLTIIFVILLFPGFAGIVLPFPALPYMFVVALIYGFIDKFQHLRPTELIILGVIMLISFINDCLSGILGAKYGGASRASLLYGGIGMILGLIIAPPFGGIPGLFAGVLIGEILMFRDHEKALKAATGSLIGTVAGMLISLVLVLVFLVLFIIFSIK